MNGSANISVETPSGKDADYENFPVGSWLLAADLRPHIAVFYNFARAIDDIADSPDISPEDKVARLDGFEEVLLGGANRPGFEKAYRMRQSLAETDIKPRHCQDLIAAFKMDATKLRYRDWDDLVAYCMLSAAPVGRYLLDLHGGSSNGYAASDALCIALQVINHLQDCQDDYRLLDRVYLPLDWMEEEGARVDNLDLNAADPALRRVLDRMIEATENTLKDAAALPGGLKSRRLAMESAVILNIAWRLSSLLRRRDPLASRVKLSRYSLLVCGVRGVFSVIF